MATVFSNVPFNTSTLNLNTYFQFAFDKQFVDNTPFSYQGVAYQDQLLVLYDTGAGEVATIFAGDDLVYSTTTQLLTGGTVTGLFSLDVSNPQFGVDWGLQGVSMSATALMAAGATVSTADDLVIIRAAFSKADVFTLSSGDDVARGYAGNDVMYGLDGNDKLYGGGGGDTLSGLTGDDQLFGGVGADKFYGGLGRDVLYAGVDSNADLFIFNSVAHSVVGINRDRIYQFDVNTDDIDLQLIDADTVLAGDQAFAFSGSVSAAHSIWVLVSGSNLVIRGDVNGDRTADFEIQLVSVAAVAAANFLL